MTESKVREEVEREEGFIDVLGNKIWYEKVGKESETPIIVLHGGPGFPHYYLKPLEKLADNNQVIFYDQLGCGNSDRPKDKSSWNVKYFVKELETLVDKLMLNNFYILGHSWGGALAVEYYLKNPSNVAGMILASPLISSPRWKEDCKGLIKTLSSKTQEILLKKNDQLVSPEEYVEATDEFYSAFFCRTKPTPKIIEKSIEEHGEQYTVMWGEEDFRPTGTLKDYDVSSSLPEVLVPVLFTCGRYDEATPSSINKWSGMVTNSRGVIFEESGHFPHIEEEKEFIDTIREFLNSIK